MASTSRIRRGRAHRELSNDVIEDSRSSQRSARDDVTEIDENPRRKLKGKGKAKAEPGVPAVIEENEEGDEEEAGEEEEEPLEIPDQPLDKARLGKLNGLASDWANIRENTHQSSFNVARDIAATIAEFGEGDSGAETLNEIDQIMKELLDTHKELELHEQVLKSMHQAVARGEEVVNPSDRYDTEIEQEKLKYQKQTTRQKYAKNDEYTRFRQTIFEVQNPGQAAPPLTDLIPKENGDDSDDDDDVQVGGVTQDYRCPISLTIFVNPLTSQTCGHSYSAEAIRQFIGRKQAVQCPASGCNKLITLASLKPNKELAKQAKEAARRERMRDDDDESDEDDVVE